MSTYRATIEGTRPLMSNRWADPDHEPPPPREAKPEIQAEFRAHRMNGPKSNLCIPALHIKACMVGAAKQITEKRRSLKTNVGAGFQVVEEKIDLGTKDYAVDCRPVEQGNGMVARYRPRLDKWSATFNVLVDDTLLQEAQVKKALEIAGSKLGIGDYRPSLPKGGSFGTFKLVELKRIKD